MYFCKLPPMGAQPLWDWRKDRSKEEKEEKKEFWGEKKENRLPRGL